MIRSCKIFVVAYAVALCPAAGSAQFDPAVLAQSTVRIVIKSDGRVKSVATGFVWQSKHQVVTSLHVMDPQAGTDPIIEFKGVKRTAKVKQVLAAADLVLLHVDDPPDWLPLESFDGAKPKYKEEISALGFNSGATGATTRELKKGYGDPETLKNILPPKDRKELAAAKVPDIELPIYYLDGSLLPGFSGSPVVNSSGALIGIGDGGLEKGASNVSWVIPAPYLDQLTASSETALPGDLTKASQSFSADIDAPEEYREIEYQQFAFVKTKTRTFAQLLETTDDREGLLAVMGIFADFTVDYARFEFDIYEDLNYGLIITMPAGVELAVGPRGVLGAQDLDWGGNSYDIVFEVGDLTEVADVTVAAEDVLNALADAHLDYLQPGDRNSFVEFEGFRTIEIYDSGKYVLRSAFNDFADEQTNSHEINYITFLVNESHYFQADGMLNRFDADFLIKYDNSLGTDCGAPGLDDEKTEVCREVENMLKILTSVHLTTFANVTKSDG